MTFSKVITGDTYWDIMLFVLIANVRYSHGCLLVARDPSRSDEEIHMAFHIEFDRQAPEFLHHDRRDIQAARTAHGHSRQDPDWSVQTPVRVRFISNVFGGLRSFTSNLCTSLTRPPKRELEPRLVAPSTLARCHRGCRLGSSRFG